MGRKIRVGVDGEVFRVVEVVVGDINGDVAREVGDSDIVVVVIAAVVDTDIDVGGVGCSIVACCFVVIRGWRRGG